MSRVVKPALGYVIFGIPIKKEKNTIITGADNPTGEEAQNGAHMATQSDIGAELGESPGRDNEVEAFN
jgi:hypothetical protein